MRIGCCAALLALAACSPAANEKLEAHEADYAATGWAAKSLPEIAAALKAGDVSAQTLTQTYLDRIERLDRNGPTLQAIIAINPNALADARTLDAKRAAGEPLGALHGVPILLKDNIESADPMATTAGALALKDNVTGRDSPLVAGLRAQGAIILGKTNMSEWANFRSNDSMSGWSAIGGQVKNPHMLDRNPCGSSSGSGAAVAASLAAGAVGTETNGSIICPSNVNGIVGFKPTVGLVSQQHIVPISPTQDTAGPMSKTVTGAAMLLSAMVSEETAGEATTDYVAALKADALSGARIGVMRFSVGDNADIQEKFDAALNALAAAGAVLVEIEAFELSTEDYGDKSLTVLEVEFRASLNDYLADAAPAVAVRSLKDLIAFNDANAEAELALFDQDLFLESEARGGLDDPAYISARADILRATGAEGVDRMMSEHNLDALVSPSGPLAPRVDPVNGDVWPAWSGAGYLAAVAGYPHLTVPMGTVHGLPIGLSFMAGRDDDAKVLALGYAYEQRTKLRADPQFLLSAEARLEIAAAMMRNRQ